MGKREREWVGRLLRRKPDLQVFRTNQKAKLGDFLVLDRSNPNRPLAFLVELKGGRGGPGNQLENWHSVARVFGVDQHLIFRPSGTADHFIELLSRGRSAWLQ